MAILKGILLLFKGKKKKPAKKVKTNENKNK
jgi:hypothetical protein